MEYSLEELNYFRVCYVTTRIIVYLLRTVFKQEWDNRHKDTRGPWKDTAKNGIDFCEMESEKSRITNSKHLAAWKKGSTLEWDGTCLCAAILYSDSIGRGLDPAIRESVNRLRQFRNTAFAHVSDGKLTEKDFKSSIQTVINAFKTLNLDTAEIEEIRNQKTFPTEELRVTQELLEKERKLNDEPQPFCVLPPKPSHQVIVRQTRISMILKEMERLRSTKPNEITVIYLSGNPGCGKSEIARQIGEKVFDGTLDQKNDKVTEVSFVFALSASSLETLIQSYMAFAISLKCDENSTTSIGTSKEFSQHDKLILLNNLVAPKLRKYSSWFLIVDNVTDLKSVLSYLPKAGEKIEGKGQILVTSQDSRSIPPADDSYTFHVSLSDGMERDEATRTLSEISGIVSDEKHTFEVAKALDFQPLALACAATYMKRVCIATPTFSWQGYLQKIQQGEREATEDGFEGINAAYPTPMTAAVRLAIENAENVMMHAFQFLSAVAADPIPLKYVVQYVELCGIPKVDAELLAANICQSSLILFSDEEPKEIRVHQVVQSCLQEMFLDESKREFEFLVKRVIATFSECLNSFDEDNVERIVETKSLTVHFMQLSKTLEFYVTNPNLIPGGNEDRKFISCLSLTGEICGIHGEYKAAHIFHKIAFHVFPNDPNILNNLGLSFHHLGQHKEAQEYLESALEIQKKAYGDDHLNVASTLNNLGLSLRDLGQYNEARKYLERALAIEEKAYGDDQSKLVCTLNYLGLTLLDLGQHPEAQNHFERALAIEEKAYCDDHPKLASTLNNLGICLLDLGQHQEAQKHFRRALAIQRKAYSENHPKVARTLNYLGLSFRGLGQHEEAQKHCEKALAIQEKVYGEHHQKLARSLNNLGLILNDQGQHKEAHKYLKRALAIQEKANAGENHPKLANTLNNLGLILRDQGQHKEAQGNFKRALAIEEKAYGENHPKLANTLNNLGLILHDQGQHKEAQGILKRALAIEEKAYGENHPKLARTSNNVGRTLHDKGQHEEA